ncbi:MAG TPA: undecaprenyl-phosphate glucose phosphotransferase [Chitinophagaceae bacterium]
MNQQSFRLLRLCFISLDLLMLNISFAFDKYYFRDKISPSFEIQYIWLWVGFNVSWLVAGWMCNIYRENSMSSFENFSNRTLRAYLYFLAFILGYFFITKEHDISRLFMITVFVSIGLVTLVNRLVFLIILQYFRKQNYLMRKIIIVGYNDMSKRLVRQLEEDTLDTKIIGFCENETEVHELSNYPILGGISNVIEISRKYNATEIFSTVLPDQNEMIYDIIQNAEQACIRFKLVPNFNLLGTFPVHIDYFGSIPVLSLRKEPLDDVANRARKRLYDVVVSSLVIIFILSWMIPLIGLAIWLESRGPIFFIQMRSGKDNKSFGCIKFRSMRVNRESHTIQATRNDPRVTKVGSFLRRTSLDEFPQFLNVFMGQMSIVGPRPHMLKHTTDFSAKINKYMVRHFLKPGITGWAQVNGFRGETRTLWDIEGRVQYDIWYLENWSLWLDTRIIFMTFYRLIVGDRKAF